VAEEKVLASFEVRNVIMDIIGVMHGKALRFLRTLLREG